MPTLHLTVDELLSTTRAVRKRLDLTRPVEAEVLRECLELAIQAPTPGSSQGWHFIVVTDPAQRAALAALYRKKAYAPGGQEDILKQMIASAADEQEAEQWVRKFAPARYLTERLHEVPVHVIPCIEGRTTGLPALEEASFWGGILPAAWSFMLAARSRGLGTVLTTLHLAYEREAAAVLGIPYEQITQATLIPVAYTSGGTDFRVGARKPLDSVVHWEHW